MIQKVSDKRKKMHQLIIQHLGDAVLSASDSGYRPLFLELNKPTKINLTVYLFPNTNPPGGRSADEYKFNLCVPGQKPGMRGDFDNTKGLPLLISYTEEYDVYIIYDADKHFNFMCNANIQSKQSLILEACRKQIATYIKKNGETLIAVTSQNLIEGIRKRLQM